MVFISLCGFYLIRVFFYFVTFFFFLHLIYFFSFSFHERILSRRFELFVFSHSRLFHTYFALPFVSPLTRFSISFCSLFHSTWRHFCPRIPRLVTSSPFFFLTIPAPCRIFVLFYFRRLHFSSSFDAYVALCPFRAVRAVVSFIVFVPRCPHCFRSVAAAAPIPLQVFHARKRAFSYFPPLFLAFVSPMRGRALARSATRYVTFSVFLFGMYARYPIRDPFYLVFILSFSTA